MVPYAEAQPVRRGIGKYTKSESETRARSGRQDTGRQYTPRKPVTAGWEPDLPTVRPGIVLDPFCGTGTTGEVAIKLGRQFIGIELYPEYAAIAEERCSKASQIRADYEKSLQSEVQIEIDSYQNCGDSDFTGCDVQTTVEIPAEL
jgi:SAM-dependent methyltransferase